MGISARQWGESSQQTHIRVRAAHKMHDLKPNFRILFRAVPTTPDPNASEKASRYKWEADRDTNWWCICYCLLRGGILLQKYRNSNGRCTAILSRVWGQTSGTRGECSQCKFFETLVTMGCTPKYGWDFPEEIPEKFQKDLGNAFRALPGIPSRVGLGSPKPYNSRHLRLPEYFQNCPPPPIRLGTLLFSEVVPDKASQSRSWNSHQYWGYF